MLSEILQRIALRILHRLDRLHVLEPSSGFYFTELNLTIENNGTDTVWIFIGKEPTEEENK